MGLLDLVTWNVIPVLIVVLILIFPFLYDTQGAIHYHSRFAFYILSVSLISIISIPFYCIRPMNVKNIMYTSYILRQVTKVLGITWELRGSEYLSKEQGCIIVANHQSMLDILGMFNIWDVMGKCAAVARKEVFYVWPFGVAAWLGGVVFIDRLNASKAHTQLNNATKLMHTDKTKLWMFPEGTRNGSRTSLLPFKKGAFRMAIACQVPILPLVYSPYYFIDDKKKIFGQGKMIIQTLPEIPTKGLTLDNIDTLMEETHKIMTETFQYLVAEVMPQSASDNHTIEQ